MKKIDERKGEVVKRKENSKIKNVNVVKEVVAQVRMNKNGPKRIYGVCLPLIET